ncbi:MAG: Na+/H+ antiporter NhaC family protein [Planctomycetaceae bacterium]|nr:Na+/H+ antiporter NhaC family protein [Planctomycetaceae bacterium]
MWLPHVGLAQSATDRNENGEYAPSAATMAAADHRTSVVGFAAELPKVLLSDVPIGTLTLRAVDADGETVTTFAGTVPFEGLRQTDRAGKSQPLREVAFHNGTAVVRSDLSRGQRVYPTADRLTVGQGAALETAIPLEITWRWLALAPPVVAILLAIVLREVVTSLVIALYSGALILSGWDPVQGLLLMLEQDVVGQVVEQDGGDPFHMTVIAFTLCMGAMVGIMQSSGGTAALVTRMGRFTGTRRRTQTATWIAGLVVFFDDYANTLLVGSMMRSITDRARVSREKLAFLVDATAAPVAGLAIISTWVGVELGYIREVYEQLGLSGDAYSIFLQTLPWRVYPLLLLGFVLMVCLSGRDFGPMRAAEQQALAAAPDLPQAVKPADSETADPQTAGSLLTGLLPIAVLLAGVSFGLWYTGTNGLAAANAERAAAGEAVQALSLWTLLDAANPNRVLLVSSFLAAAVAMACAACQRTHPLHDLAQGGLNGAGQMLPAVVVLVLAWGISSQCSPARLNTAGVLIELTHGLLPATGMPALTFLMAAGISLATGSSWSTMGLLMPLSVGVTFHLLAASGSPIPGDHPLLLGTVGAVLAGSIFGDHCSPISDTTVLSSAAAGCDHLQHVLTQLPYAGAVGAVSLLCCYIPAGLGLPILFTLPVAALLLYGLLRLAGSRLEESAER